MDILRLKQLWVLVRQDLSYALRSARGLLFLIFFGLFWLWVLRALSDGSAKELANPEVNSILSWLFDRQIGGLFINRPPTLSAYFFLALKTLPIFCMIASCDQTASDIGTKHIRFLAPRCNRIEIFLGRFIGAFLLIASAYLIVTVSAMLISSNADEYTGSYVNYAVYIFAAQMLYALPFVALMTFFSASVGSAGLSALIGISTYVVILLVVSFSGINWPAISELLSLLLPNSVQSSLLSSEGGTFINALILLPIYTICYGTLGWLIFSKRDI